MSQCLCHCCDENRLPCKLYLNSRGPKMVSFLWWLESREVIENHSRICTTVRNDMRLKCTYYMIHLASMVWFHFCDKSDIHMNTESQTGITQQQDTLPWQDKQPEWKTLLATSKSTKSDCEFSIYAHCRQKLLSGQHMRLVCLVSIRLVLRTKQTSIQQDKHGKSETEQNTTEQRTV